MENRRRHKTPSKVEGSLLLAKRRRLLGTEGDPATERIQFIFEWSPDLARDLEELREDRAVVNVRDFARAWHEICALIWAARRERGDQTGARR
ncbi:MAG: hypothetical protein AB1515_02475 [Nitrospirota bacterium]